MLTVMSTLAGDVLPLDAFKRGAMTFSSSSSVTAILVLTDFSSSRSVTAIWVLTGFSSSSSVTAIFVGLTLLIDTLPVTSLKS